MSRVIATAGHVDHGKSTLVRTLTGRDPDRFAEEQRRGLTIDLGFAWTTLPSGAEAAFVDVPGHVRFIKNMLAGAGGVEACLFVVAATEGWKPQSEEHLRILELLGIEHGVVALTMVDLADGARLAEVRAQLERRLRGTFLAGAEVVPTSAPVGGGMDELRRALDRLVASTPVPVDRGRPRLWVDRSFAVAGAGTVVTGTLAGGALHTGDELVLVAGGRERPVRVRSLQSMERREQRLAPGCRAAVNVTGLGHRGVRRGDALVRPRQWHLTVAFDASLRVLDALAHDVSRRGAYVAYLGSGEHPVRLRLLGRDALAPGEEGFARLHLDAPLPLLAGDRFVLRESGRGETVGGGLVLDVDPVRRASEARPDRSVERVIAERGWVDVEDLERLTGERRPPDVGRWVVDPSALERARADVRRKVAEGSALDERDRAVLAQLDDVADAPLDKSYLRTLEATPYAPPSPEEAGVARRDARRLERSGLVVEHDGRWFAESAVASAAREVARLLEGTPGGVRVGAVAAALGTTRKYAVPLLSLLDARGITRRRGDLRIAGPRLETS